MNKRANRPTNIGIGTYQKYIDSKICQAINIFKVVSIGSVAVFTGLDVVAGIMDNIEKDSSVEKIIYDAAVDVVITGGISVASIAVSSKVGAAIGTAVCPGVGTAIGAVAGATVSFIGWLLFDCFGWRDDVKELVS